MAALMVIGLVLLSLIALAGLIGLVIYLVKRNASGNPSLEDRVRSLEIEAGELKGRQSHD